ncbi:hypothetical protein CU633_09645 [Bacillus sp. V3-13]|uniref:hypothetical protein n=1 Tax=Bacillus sp. V3-13 TaxID=2053728 RepID=UPI000C7621B7|nr:hypothetical protein CU633_09645 [Bacillus sp. V3-13]
MSLKSIEMQVALPRTQDAGRIQEQLQQRGQHLIEHAAESVQKNEEKQRKTVQKNEQKGEVKMSKDESKKQDDGSKQESKQEKEKKAAKELHPYKGTIIDYSG